MELQMLGNLFGRFVFSFFPLPFFFTFLSFPLTITCILFPFFFISFLPSSSSRRLDGPHVCVRHHLNTISLRKDTLVKRGNLSERTHICPWRGDCTSFTFEAPLRFFWFLAAFELERIEVYAMERKRNGILLSAVMMFVCLLFSLGSVESFLSSLGLHLHFMN